MRFRSLALLWLAVVTTVAAQTNGRVIRPASTHPLATAAADRGQVPAGTLMNRLTLVLRKSPEQQSDLKGLLARQLDAGSADYHRWLKPDEFGKRFGPSDADMTRVSSWLAAQGLHVDAISHGRATIEFSGQAGAVERAFGAEIHKFQVDGKDYLANASDISIPAELTDVVDGPLSLHNFPVGAKPRRKEDAVRPLYADAVGRHFLTPPDFATIYNLPAGYTGKGVTIAVVGNAMFDVSDVNEFRTLSALPVNPPAMQYNGIAPAAGDGDPSEARLDVEWAGGVAPGANVIFVAAVGANSANTLYLSEQYIVDNNLADIISESFGICEGSFSTTELAQQESLREQSAAQGMTWVVAAGDSGAFGCADFHANLWYPDTPTLGVNAFASSPYTVAVGGTEFQETASPSPYWNSSGAAIGYIPEAAWNQSCMPAMPCFTSVVAGGGGVSTRGLGKPPWQAALTPPDGSRDVPDVALSASWQIDPYLTCNNGGCGESPVMFGGSGGTSAATPSFAGILARVEEKNGSGRMGAVNSILYGLAQAENYPHCTSNCIFNDITVGTTYTGTTYTAFVVDGQQAVPPYPAVTGYDNATGLGSVNAGNLIAKWPGNAPVPTATRLSISPAAAVHGTPIQITASVSPQSGSGTPTGPLSLFTGNQSVAFMSLPQGSNQAQALVGNLPGGSYSLVAEYGGDGTYAMSKSAPVSIAISPESSETSVSVQTAAGATSAATTTTSATYGSALFLSATVTGASGYPTGAVTFTDSGNSISGGTAVPNTSALAQVEVTTLAPGNHAISASFAGDSSFAPSASTAPASLQIRKATVTLAVSEVCAQVGDAVTVTIAAQGLGLAPSGSVVFSSGTGALATVPLAVSKANAQTATAGFTVPATLSPLPAVITVSYAGDTNYTPPSAMAIQAGLAACAGSMLNAATNSYPATPGGLASIYGSQMTNNMIAQAPTADWPTSLGGITVTLTDSMKNSAQAQLYYVSPTQINLYVPPNLVAGAVTVQVSGAQNSFQANLVSYWPAIFIYPSDNVNMPAAQTLAVSANGTQSPFAPIGPITIPPASQGELYLILYGTGIRNYPTSTDIQVTIGNTKVGSYPVQPTYAGAQSTYPGLDQINVPIPSVLAGTGNINVTVTVNQNTGMGTALFTSNTTVLVQQ